MLGLGAKKNSGLNEDADQASERASLLQTKIRQGHPHLRCQWLCHELGSATRAIKSG